MRSWSRTSVAALAALLAGAIVLFLAEAEWLRVISATVIVTGIALGVFAIATPELLADREDETDSPG